MPTLEGFDGPKKSIEAPVKHKALPKAGIILAAVIAIVAITIGAKTLMADNNSSQYQGFIKAVESYE